MHSWGGEIYRSASLSGAFHCLRGRRMVINERQDLQNMRDVQLAEFG